MGEVLEEMLNTILKNYKLCLIECVINRKRIEVLTKDFLKQLYHKLIVHTQYIRIKQ